MNRFRAIYEIGGRNLARNIAKKLLFGGKISPNLVTVTGTALNACAAAIIFNHHFLVGAIVFLLGSLLDAMDGAIAKVTNQVSPFGAFLDSTLDRVSEGFVLGGLGLMYAREDNLWALAACFVAMACSFLVSYTRARAEALGVECKVGLASRVERVILITAGLVGAAIYRPAIEIVVYILATTATLTVLQRILHVRKELQSSTP